MTSFGLLTLGDLITDPVTGARRSHAERHRNIVEQAVRAEEVGFTSVHLGEHHFCDYILSAPPIVLAAIAERTTTLRLSTGVALGVNLDPVRLAEDYATVDVLSGGRVEPCVGRGTFFPHTFDAFGQDPSTAKDVFAENLELLVRLWTEERVTSETAVCRSPAQVVDRLGDIAARLSLDTQILMLDMGGMSNDELFSAIDLLGSDVLPHLQSVTAMRTDDVLLGSGG